MDTDLRQWIVDHRLGVLNPLFEGLSLVGSFGIVWLALAVVLAGFSWRRPWLLLRVAVAILLAEMVSGLLKVELERDRLFGAAWVFLAHESEIPSPGDYVVRRVVEDSFIVVRDEESGRYLTPNGNHRLTALKELGSKTAIALLVPEHEVAYQILALNIEKAYNLREKAIEVVRLYRELARLAGSCRK